MFSKKSYSKFELFNSSASICLLIIFPLIILIKDIIMYNFKKQYINNQVNYYFLFFYIVAIQLTRIPESDFATNIALYANFKNYTLEFIFESVNNCLILIPIQFKITFTLFWLTFIYFFWFKSLKKLNLLNIESLLLCLFIPYFFVNTLHLTQQFASVSLFFYGFIFIITSKKRKNKYIGFLIIALSIFIHSATLLLVPFIFFRQYKFKFWHLLIIVLIAFFINKINILELFFSILNYIPDSSILNISISQKLSSVINEASNDSFVLPTLAYFEAGIILIIGIVYYGKLTKTLQTLFLTLISCFIIIVVFSIYPILALRYYVYFQFLKIFFYSFFFFEYKPSKKVLQPIGYLIIFFSVYSFYFNFTTGPFSFNGIYSLELLTMNIIEIINNITY